MCCWCTLILGKNPSFVMGFLPCTNLEGTLHTAVSTNSIPQSCASRNPHSHVWWSWLKPCLYSIADYLALDIVFLSRVPTLFSQMELQFLGLEICLFTSFIFEFRSHSQHTPLPAELFVYHGPSSCKTPTYYTTPVCWKTVFSIGQKH